MRTLSAYPRRVHRDADGSIYVAEDVAGLTILFVNVYFIGPRGGGRWVLVDAGLPMTGDRIRRAARHRFGDEPPAAIVLTHGHFDHIGALGDLLDHWPDVTVYAHRLELPYLTGQSPYPPPDPTVGGGLMARSSFMLPKGPFDFGDRIQPIPADTTIPELPEWSVIHTPGHAPGHVSLWRDTDGLLIAGDAFVTTKQESLSATLSQRMELHGPPAYFTPDWQAAKASIDRLLALQPQIAATGHGWPMETPRLLFELRRLARHFETDGMPAHGRYVREPARADEQGVTYLPPAVNDPWPKIALGTAALATFALFMRSRRRGL